MSSLSRELTLWIGGGLIITMVLAGWLLLRMVREQGEDEFDRSSMASVQTLSSYLEHDGEFVEFDGLGEDIPEEYRRGERPSYFAIWLLDGPKVAFSESLERAAIEGHELPRRVGDSDRADSWNMTLPDGRPGRAIGAVVPVSWEDEDEAIPGEEVFAEVVIARSRHHLDRAEAASLRGLLVAGSALMVTAAIVLALGLARMRRRLSMFSAQLRNIDEGSLDERVSTRDLVKELRPLGETLNQLLERLDQSFARERRMNSNIAHEMRTPIAELRSAVDVARRWPEDEQLAQRALDAAADVSVRLSATVHTLLRLSRLREPGQALEREVVDLARTIHEIARHSHQERGDDCTVVEWKGPESLSVLAERTLLESLVRNLIENAYEHSSPKPLLRSELVNGRAATWTLRNPCAGLDPQDLERITEPFWQKDAARSASLHAGLGLSLVRSITDALGWDLEFDVIGEEFLVRVRIPPQAVMASQGRETAPRERTLPGHDLDDVRS